MPAVSYSLIAIWGERVLHYCTMHQRAAYCDALCCTLMATLITQHWMHERDPKLVPTLPVVFPQHRHSWM
jgi:hypothetical protein